MKRMICPYKMCPRKRRTMLFLCRLCLKSIIALQWYLAPHPHPLSQSSSVHVCNLSNLSHTMFFFICDKQHVSPPGHSERFNDGRESQEDKKKLQRERGREGGEREQEREGRCETPVVAVLLQCRSICSQCFEWLKSHRFYF